MNAWPSVTVSSLALPLLRHRLSLKGNPGALGLFVEQSTTRVGSHRSKWPRTQTEVASIATFGYSQGDLSSPVMSSAEAHHNSLLA